MSGSSSSNSVLKTESEQLRHFIPEDRGAAFKTNSGYSLPSGDGNPSRERPPRLVLALRQVRSPLGRTCSGPGDTALAAGRGSPRAHKTGSEQCLQSFHVLGQIWIRAAGCDPVSGTCPRISCRTDQGLLVTALSTAAPWGTGSCAHEPAVLRPRPG